MSGRKLNLHRWHPPISRCGDRAHAFNEASTLAGLSTYELAEYATLITEDIPYYWEDGSVHYYTNSYGIIPNSVMACTDDESTEEEPHLTDMIIYW